MENEKEYVLGTHDEEILRLGLQHRVWRPRALDAWRRAGFTSGQSLLDVGCGPGYASIDLAEIVGPTGMVFSIDRSKRFLDALKQSGRQHELVNIKTFEIDLNESALPDVCVDGAWVRWVFAFVKQPRILLAEITKTIKPGGMLVLHEYFDYSTWQVVPKSLELEEFVREVMESWRSEGGEPNIGLNLPGWLNEMGYSVKTMNPIIDVITSSNYTWQWLKTFCNVGLRRLVDLGRVSPERAKEIQKAFDTREADPNAIMFTPGVLEIIAVR